MAKKKSVEENWPIYDFKEISAKVKKIVDAATELTEFEADFLKEIARMAMKFQKTFRMTPKQVEMLEELNIKHCIAGEIDAKTKKRKTDDKEGKGDAAHPKRRPRKTKPNPTTREGQKCQASSTEENQSSDSQG